MIFKLNPSCLLQSTKQGTKRAYHIIIPENLTTSVVFNTIFVHLNSSKDQIFKDIKHKQDKKN